MADIIMILGGSGSGKSAWAEKLAGDLQARRSWPVYYLATGTVCDEEFARRVELHRQRRPADWTTIEEGCDLAGVLRNQKCRPAVYLVDGIGTWLTNQMFEKSQFYWDAIREKECLQRVQALIQVGKEVEGALILVADEVGMDVVPQHEQARIFRDLNGRANQIVATAARTVYFVAAGIPLCLKGGE